VGVVVIPPDLADLRRCLVPAHPFSPGRLQLLTLMRFVFSVLPVPTSTFSSLSGQVAAVCLYFAFRTLHTLHTLLLIVMFSLLLFPLSSTKLSLLLFYTFACTLLKQGCRGIRILGLLHLQLVSSGRPREYRR